jgi:hypothetical protein
MNGKIVVVLVLVGLGVSNGANAVSEDGTDALAPVQLPAAQFAEGGKLGDKYMSGQAGGRYAIGAGPQLLTGDEFITVMQNNTLSGTTAAGDAFNVYFLPGGAVTYRDARGARDSGTWHLDQDGVCVDWRNPGDKAQGCFRVLVEGDRVTLQGPSGNSRATLRGGIAETFLKDAEQ